MAKSISTQSVVSSIAMNSIIFGSFVTGFLILRLKFKRIYAPKSSYDLVPEDKKPTPLPKDPIRWIFILLSKPDSFIIQQSGLDGYFFLRYLRVMGTIFACGMVIFIILFPVNAVNGVGLKGFDLLSISNVADQSRYYAHVFVGWIFYGCVIFVLYRELFFYNSLRVAALSSPMYAKKRSSRTILFQNVPRTLLDEKQFFKLFNGVKRIYISRIFRKLENKCLKREIYAMKLEAAETKLLRMAVKAKKKAEKKGTIPEPCNDIKEYVPEKKRPKMKVNGTFSKKVDTIEYCREILPKLSKEIKSLKKVYYRRPPQNSLFVEFETQYMAQLAFQSITHHNPLRMTFRYVGLEPGDIIWNNMRIFWWEKITRRFIAYAFIAFLVIFWAVPVAFVGVISNVTYLTDKLHWLRWIDNLPDQLYGLVTSNLPTVMLLLLNTFLPIFIRAAAKVSGMPSRQHAEFFTQKSYFFYLIVNGFLVTALSSSAAAAVSQIVEEPTLALNILASNLPKSSNFYISFIILQGLAISSGTLFQIVGLFMYYVLGYLLDSTLRKKWGRFSGLGGLLWGTTFPVYTNLACITLAFSIISPVILFFASAAFLLLFIAFSHNLSYIYIESPDARGLHYPTALKQTFTGLYLGQVCLLGIFAVGKGWGPIVLQAIGLGSTVFFHIHINEAFDKLLQVVPIDVMKPLDGVSETPSFKGETEYKSKVLDKKHMREIAKAVKKDKEQQENIVEDLKNEALNGEGDVEHIVPLLADRDFKTTESKNFLVRFIRPDVYLNFRHVKSLLPATFNIEPEEEDDKHAYHNPIMSNELPTLWIPKDPMGLSTVEIENTPKSIQITDENSGFTKKGKIQYLGPAP